ncbi:hypothetical protein AB0F81_45630 [Actinoplanes sp. NPDC024001]|uniref:hypothetical protein n=1 Tax=Actinoplanes sp. NPDC024001 TaxID=3154598 RepID=UPI003404069A
MEQRYLAVVTDLARRLLDAGDPYWVAVEIHGESAQVMTDVDVAASIYLIWAELTDWVELRPGEQEQAFAGMRRAAQEWLALDPGDRDGLGRYLDRWVHNECGYSR